jgi:hypothetical protein
MVRNRVAVAALAVIMSLLLAVPAIADDGEEGSEPEPASPGTELVSGAISGEFGTSPEEAAALHDSDIGWGVVFKLALLWVATGEEPSALLASVVGEDGEFEFAWGEWFKSLDETQLANLEGFARNLGQLISAEKRGHGRPEHAVGPASEEHSGRGRGPSGEPPGQAKKNQG